MVQKVAVKRELEAGLRYATTVKLCQPSSKWVPFSNLGRIRQRKERDRPRLPSAVPKIQLDSNPHYRYGNYAIENLYVFGVYNFLLLCRLWLLTDPPKHRRS